MRRASAIAAVAAASLALAGCSGGSGDEGGDDGGNTVEVFTWWAAGTEKDALEALVDVFDEQHPDIEFVNGAVAGGAGSDARDLLQTRLQAGEPTDIFPDQLIDLLTVEGAIYSIPSNIHRANVVWANPEVLEDAGVDPEEPPSDLDAWISDLKKVQDAGYTALSVGEPWTQVHLLETVL